MTVPSQKSPSTDLESGLVPNHVEHQPDVKLPSSPPDDAELEMLGRKRPDVLTSWWVETGFLFSILMSMGISEFFISGFHAILPPLAETLQIPPAAQTWSASVFSLVLAALLLPFGRIADLIGPRPVFVGGVAWFAVWALAGGFAPSYTTVVAFRALQAIGAAAFFPSGIILLARVYRPGPRKNIAFGLYGAFAGFGFFFGIFVGGLAAGFLDWRWYSWIGAAITAVVVVVAFFSVPVAAAACDEVAVSTMDWWGCLTTIPGFLLFVYSLTACAEAPAGFATPYIIVTFVLGTLLLASAVYVEGWVSSEPLLPGSLFAINYMKPMVCALFCSYGAFGMYMFYATFYIERVLHASPLLTVAYFVPMIVGGMCFSGLGGFILHRISGTLLLLISATGSTLCMFLFAIMPPSLSSSTAYWGFVFPAMIAATAGVDITFTVTNVFITTSLPSRLQAVGGALISAIVFVGIGFWLAIANIAVTAAAAAAERRGTPYDDRDRYRVAMWLGTAVGLIGLSIFCFAVRVEKAKSDLTVEEKDALRESIIAAERPSQ